MAWAGRVMGKVMTMTFASCAVIRRYMYCLLFQVAWHFVIILIMLSDCLNQSYDTQLKTMLHLTLIITSIRLLKPQSPLSTTVLLRTAPTKMIILHDHIMDMIVLSNTKAKVFFQVFFCTMLSVCDKKLFDGSVQACINLMMIKVALHPN